MDILPQTTLARSSTTVRLTRLLPQRGEVTVQKEEQVSPTQIIARSYKTAKYEILDTKDILGLDPAELEDALLVEVGTVVEEGSPLLRITNSSDNGGVFPSPVSGILEEVFDGSLIIQKPQSLFELRAMVQGIVSRLIPGLGVEIQLVGSIVQAIWDSGKEGYGPLFTATKSNYDDIKLADVRGELGRSIVVAGRLSSAELIDVLENYQARGLIVGSIPAALIPKAREVMFPVFVTDGFGEQPMNAHIFGVLQHSSGRDASLLRAQGENNTERSQIVIPAAESQGIVTDQAGWNLLKAGDFVRVIKSRHNLPGKVITVHPEARRTVSGSWMPGADVELKSGEVVFVPYTNIDVIN